MAQRFEGRNLEDALENAALALGVERYLVGYHVVLERRGFLGGIKRIVIEAEAKSPGEVQVPVAAAVSEPAASTTIPIAARRSSSPAPRSGGRGGHGPGRRDDSRRDSAGRGRGRRDRDDDRTNRAAHLDDEIVPRQADESAAARSVRQWLNELFDVAELDLDVRTSETDEQIDVRLYGSDARLVLSRGGELLDALQVIVNKALGHKGTSRAIELDCRNFKKHRLDSIGEQAREVADQVRRSGREELLPAMTPVERRIVHLTLQDDAELTTESRGEGFFKRVAILPRKSSQAPEP